MGQGLIEAPYTYFQLSDMVLRHLPNPQAISASQHLLEIMVTGDFLFLWMIT